MKLEEVARTFALNNIKIKGNNLEDFTNIIKRNFKKTEFDDVMGLGNFGVAFILNNGKILKITGDQTEINAASIILKNPRKNIVKIYNVKITEQKFYHRLSKSKKINIGFILEEFVPYGLHEIIGKILDKIVKQVKNKFKITNKIKTRTIMQKATKHLINKLYQAGEEHYFDEIIQVADGVDQLYKLGIYYVDPHSENILETEKGVFKIIDLGFNSALKSKSITQINRP